MKRMLASLTLALVSSPLLATLPQPLAYWDMDALDADGKVLNLGSSSVALGLGASNYLTNFSAKGKALWLDVSQQSAGRTAANMPALTSRTVSFWVYRDPNPGNDPQKNWPTSGDSPNMPTLIGNFSSLIIRYGVITDTSIQPYIGEGGALGAFYPMYSIGRPLMSVGAWQHFAISFDVTSSRPDDITPESFTIFDMDIKVYVNGSAIYSGQGVTSNLNKAATWYVGNVANGTRPFKGAIDEIKVWDRVLTEDQVAEEYERVNAENNWNMLLWYPMDEMKPDGNGGYAMLNRAVYGGTMTASDHTCPTNGPCGGAIHFDGTATTYAQTTVPVQVRDYTWSAWVRPAEESVIVRIPGQSNNFPRLWTYGASQFYYPRGHQYLMQYCVPQSGVQNANNSFRDMGPWQHLVYVYRYTYDDENAKKAHAEIWCNGVRTHVSTNYNQVATAINNAFWLGNASVNGTRVFEGDMQDVRFFSGALSSNEIVRLYRGAAAVDAGEDAAYSGARGVLIGKVGSKAMDVASGYDGRVSWSLVSCPAGGESVGILRPSNPVSEVTLPVEGEYVFKLRTDGFAGAFNEDTVRIVRDDAKGEVPVVPAVDTAAVVAERAVAAGIDADLVRHWTFDRIAANGCKDSVANAEATYDWSNFVFSAGVSGTGMMSRDFTRGIYLGNGQTGWAEASDPNSNPAGQPKEEWRTISLWMYQDKGLTESYRHYSPCLFSQRTTLWINLNRYDNPKTDGLRQDSGIMIIQSGVSGASSRLWYAAPYSFTNRWTHVYAAINRLDSSKIEVWIDGVKQTPSSTSFGTYAATGAIAGGRYQGSQVVLGGIDYDAKDYSSQSNAIYSVAYDTATGEFLSRTFPGYLDDLRIYKRKLTEAEIAYLASHPDMGANEAPAVGAATVGDGGLVVSKDTKGAAADAADDGNPSGTLTYEWIVLKGDAANMQFADRTARETRVTFLKKGDYTLCLKASDGERVTYGEPKTVSVTANGMMLLIR